MLSPTMPLAIRFVLAAVVTLPVAASAADTPPDDAAGSRQSAPGWWRCTKW